MSGPAQAHAQGQEDQLLFREPSACMTGFPIAPIPKKGILESSCSLYSRGGIAATAVTGCFLLRHLEEGSAVSRIGEPTARSCIRCTGSTALLPVQLTWHSLSSACSGGSEQTQQPLGAPERAAGQEASHAGEYASPACKTEAAEASLSNAGEKRACTRGLFLTCVSLMQSGFLSDVLSPFSFVFGCLLLVQQALQQSRSGSKNPLSHRVVLSAGSISATCQLFLSNADRDGETRGTAGEAFQQQNDCTEGEAASLAASPPSLLQFVLRLCMLHVLARTCAFRASCIEGLVLLWLAPASQQRQRQEEIEAASEQQLEDDEQRRDCMSLAALLRVRDLQMLPSAAFASLQLHATAKKGVSCHLFPDAASCLAVLPSDLFTAAVAAAQGTAALLKGAKVSGRDCRQTSAFEAPETGKKIHPRLPSRRPLAIRKACCEEADEENSPTRRDTTAATSCKGSAASDLQHAASYSSRSSCRDSRCLSPVERWWWLGTVQGENSDMTVNGIRELLGKLQLPRELPAAALLLPPVLHTEEEIGQRDRMPPLSSVSSTGVRCMRGSCLRSSSSSDKNKSSNAPTTKLIRFALSTGICRLSTARVVCSSKDASSPAKADVQRRKAAAAAAVEAAAFLAVFSANADSKKGIAQQRQDAKKGGSEGSSSVTGAVSASTAREANSATYTEADTKNTATYTEAEAQKTPESTPFRGPDAVVEAVSFFIGCSEVLMHLKEACSTSNSEATEKVGKGGLERLTVPSASALLGWCGLLLLSCSSRSVEVQPMGEAARIGVYTQVQRRPVYRQHIRIVVPGGWLHWRENGLLYWVLLLLHLRAVYKKCKQRGKIEEPSGKDPAVDAPAAANNCSKSCSNNCSKSCSSNCSKSCSSNCNRSCSSNCNKSCSNNCSTQNVKQDTESFAQSAPAAEMRGDAPATAAEENSSAEAPFSAWQEESDLSFLPESSSFFPGGRYVQVSIQRATGFALQQELLLPLFALVEAIQRDLLQPSLTALKLVCHASAAPDR
ncbi:hypothetical protein cyc_00400 [Cyclospora cayetanensis]|uniref:Uncharacterized protein n=1 Tax=Cyclospora cayetanensis TaxID=88456 RepID=A0A1D3D9B3_9EIME|nr:hypothetical protein cyc_00400 [Cyclospora cayetanensis]